MGLALDLTGTTVGGLAREISGHLNDTYQQEITVQDLDEAIAIVRAEDEEYDYTICVLKRRKTPADDTAG